ncbi:MAG TPA: hypothetical protein VG367_08855 [Mucilaginibacter sp.]|nr:hypothetical protein [Mucilaginibacter sp.]
MRDYMEDFHTKREEFLKKVSKLTTESNLPVSEIRLHQIPEPGIVLPDDTDPEIVRKIMKIYNEVFR